MWLSPRLKRISSHPGPVLLGPNALGSPHLIAAHADDAPLVWLELEAADANDPFSVGVKLSDAVKRALGSRLFPAALPYPAALAFLGANAELLSPLVLAVSRADQDLDVAKACLKLHRHGVRVLLAGEFTTSAAEQLRTSTAGALLVLGERDLALTDDEALSLAAGRLEPGEIRRLLAASGGAYEVFTAALHQHLGLPVTAVPSPTGPRLPAGFERPVDPGALLDVLVAKGDWVRAAEVAVTSVPARAAEVLAEAAHVFHERGLHRRLWRLLERLPEGMKGLSGMLLWRLSAAVRLGREGELKGEVETHLNQFEAPDLRALHAGVFLQPDEARLETRRAAEAQATPFTLYQYGHFLADPAEGAKVLRDAVRLAERVGRPYEVARNAGTLTARLIDAGAYREAAAWGGWALGHFDRHEVGDTQRRLYLLNNWAYARILIGDTAGLEALLRDGEAQLSQAFPGLLKLFRSTLGNYLVATDRSAQALTYYRPNWEAADRWSLGVHGLNMVQALLSFDLPEVKAAKEIAERAFFMTKGEGWDYHYPAQLARGLVLVHEQPEEAAPLLRGFLESRRPLAAPHEVLATLHLARAQLSLDRPDEARRLVEALPSRDGLSPPGLRLLSGSTRFFGQLDRWCLGTDAPLELRFLGRTEAVYQGSPLALAPQQRDILALLAYHRGGVSAEQLMAYLTGDRANHAALYAAISKLRQQVPVSPSPYALQVPVQADFLEVLEHLQQGRVRPALERYRGPLLPGSEAPEVRALREVIEESRRRAALSSGDPEVLLDLARALGDDFEVWEAALQALPRSDPRRPLVEAQATLVFENL